VEKLQVTNPNMLGYVSQTTLYVDDTIEVIQR
jgi:4-hydroxy-3-methylbut-2-enyl diphosphate reductase IspH